MIKKNIKILVCEDEPIIAMDLQSIIRRLGYKVTSVVKTGEELLLKSVNDDPDIIISDISLQGESTSLEALKTISLNKKTPIIFLSGIMNAVDIISKSAINPCYHIPKPYLPNHIKETIEKCISGKNESGHLKI